MSTLTKLQGNRYLLVLNEKGDKKEHKQKITTIATDYIAYYKIPSGTGGRCFSTRPRDVEKSGFLTPSPNSFQLCTEKDKLYVCGHGDATSCGMYDAEATAQLLRDSGLTTIGLVTFKSCNIGIGHFLEDFVTHCGKKGIKIGFAKGYTASLFHTVEGDVRKPMSIIAAKVKKGTDIPTAWSSKSNQTRWKLVRGPLSDQLAWGRFQTEEQRKARAAALSRAQDDYLDKILDDLDDDKYNKMFT